MPASQATSGMGTILRRNGIEIAEVKDIDGPGFESDNPEVTHLRSPDYWREFIGGLKDGSELTFKVNFLPSNATHNAATGLLSGFAGSGTIPTDTWQMVFPDPAATTWTLYGPIKSFKTGAQTDKGLEAEVTVKLTGKPILA